MKETTLELLQRLKRIEIEKWNLGIESTQIMEEIWMESCRMLVEQHTIISNWESDIVCGIYMKRIEKIKRT